jgi:type VI protein secretion system component VasK
MNVLAYFARPFPSRKGFSPYRSPGPVAHRFFFLAIVVLGLLLCGASPLLVIWAAAGIYLGRELAILCHYAPVLFLLVMAALCTLLATAKPLALFGRQHPASAIAVTALLLATQIWVACATARGDH